MTAIDELDRFAEMLKDKGETGLRLHAVERARNFKRSWLEMAPGAPHGLKATEPTVMLLTLSGA